MSYRNKPGDENSLDQNFVLSVFEDSQRELWIGNDGVLNRLNREKRRFTFYRQNNTDAGNISDGTVLSTVEDHSGILWFATYRGGLNSFDRKTGRFKAYRHNPSNPNSPSSDVIIRLLLDRTQVLWLGTEYGLDRLELKTRTFSRYPDLTEKLAGRAFRPSPRTVTAPCGSARRMLECTDSTQILENTGLIPTIQNVRAHSAAIA
jgi:ligand-binding sensor domain-containing protein